MEGLMLRTVALNTVNIADRISETRNKLRIAALACEGLPDECGDQDNVRIANMLSDIGGELAEISDVIHPPSTSRLEAQAIKSLTSF
jgi:hypothetical protein